MTSTNATSVLYLPEADAAIHPPDETASGARLLGAVVNGNFSFFIVYFHHRIAPLNLVLSSVPPESRPDDRRPLDTASNTSERGGHRGGGGSGGGGNGGSPADGATNTGTNLFVTGIHPRLTEDDVTRLFAKYGDVEKCQIMLDPHSKESRGFGFVKMATLEQADSAKERLQGEVFEGRTLSIEKARRSRPRTPTPGKYFGPPKRGKFGVLTNVIF